MAVPCVSFHRAWLSPGLSLISPLKSAKASLPSEWAHKKRREFPPIRLPKLPFRTRGVGTPGRRHPVVIITEALSGPRHTRPRSTALDSRAPPALPQQIPTSA